VGESTLFEYLNEQLPERVSISIQKVVDGDDLEESSSTSAGFFEQINKHSIPSVLVMMMSPPVNH
jgi:hypothetical protein